MTDQQTLDYQEQTYRELRDLVSREQVIVKMNCEYYCEKIEKLEKRIKLLSILSGLTAPLTVFFLLVPGIPKNCSIVLASILSLGGTIAFILTDRSKWRDTLSKYKNIQTLLSLMDAEIDRLWDIVNNRKYATIDDCFRHFEIVKTWWVAVNNVGVHESGDEERLTAILTKIEIQLGLRTPPTENVKNEQPNTKVPTSETTTV